MSRSPHEAPHGVGSFAIELQNTRVEIALARGIDGCFSLGSPVERIGRRASITIAGLSLRRGESGGQEGGLATKSFI